MRRFTVIAAVLLLSVVFPAGATAADDDNGAEERVVILGDVLVDRDDTSKDVFVGQGDVTIRGTVDGDVFVGDGDVTVRGTVRGDVVTFGGQAILGRRARITGDVVYFDSKPQVTSGADVGGEVKRVDPESVGAVAKVGVWIAIAASAFVLGLLLLLLAPKVLPSVARAATKSPLLSALLGLVLFCAIPVLGVLLCVTLIGIPLGLVLLLLILPLWSLAYVGTSFVIGRLVLKKGPGILALLLGVAVLSALGLIPIAGDIIWLLATILGLGALFAALLKAR